MHLVAHKFIEGCAGVCVPVTTRIALALMYEILGSVDHRVGASSWTHGQHVTFITQGQQHCVSSFGTLP